MEHDRDDAPEGFESYADPDVTKNPSEYSDEDLRKLISRRAQNKVQYDKLSMLPSQRNWAFYKFMTQLIEELRMQRQLEKAMAATPGSTPALPPLSQTTLQFGPTAPTSRPISPFKRPRTDSIPSGSRFSALAESFEVETPLKDPTPQTQDSEMSEEPLDFLAPYNPEVNYLPPTVIAKSGTANYTTWMVQNAVSPLLTTIKSLVDEVSTLKATVARLQTYTRPQQPPPPPAPQPQQQQPKAPKPAAPKPQKQAKASYAEAARKPAQPAPKTPSPAKKKKVEPLFKPQYTKVNREFVVELSEPAPKEVTVDTILAKVNLTLKGTGVSFLFVRFTNKSNLVFSGPPNQSGDSASPYADNISAALLDLSLSPTSAKANSRWTKFILHGVPTSVGEGIRAGEEVAAHIELNLPKVQLAQIPRWLSKDRTNKTHSSMVIAFPGQVTLDTLGVRYLFILNKMCRLEPYVPITPATQCQNCQQYGHHHLRCKKEPCCAVCAGPHHSTSHKCNSCKGGLKCTHLPIKCANCPQNPGHKANDPACPTRAKTRISGKGKEIEVEMMD